jgi:hypothetical protein
MRLARRDPHRDQPSIGIGEIPPYSDPNCKQRRQRQFVPPLAPRSQERHQRAARASPTRDADARGGLQSNPRGTTGASALLQQPPLKKLSSPPRPLAAQVRPAPKMPKKKQEPALRVRVLSVASHRFPPMIDAQEAPSSPQAQGADDGQGASPPPERRPFCARAQAKPEPAARQQR